MFDHKPYAHYRAVTSKRIEISLYDHEDMTGQMCYSGTFAAVFTCYDPFARMESIGYTDSCDSHTLARTGILPTAMMPAEPNAESRSFLLYNPGTEAAHTVIRLAGDVGDGMLIRNLTNGQRCQVINLRNDSLLEGACLELDSEKGQTRIALGESTELAFAFHDEGYITLAPCTPFVRSFPVTFTVGSNIVTSLDTFQPSMVGQFIYLDGWKRIGQINDVHTAVLSERMAASGTTETPVVTMNEIEISGEGMDLTTFEITYTPRVR